MKWKNTNTILYKTKFSEVKRLHEMPSVQAFAPIAFVANGCVCFYIFCFLCLICNCN